jgi:hypothetical protein
VVACSLDDGGLLAHGLLRLSPDHLEAYLNVVFDKTKATFLLSVQTFFFGSW